MGRSPWDVTMQIYPYLGATISTRGEIITSKFNLLPNYFFVGYKLPILEVIG